MPCFMDHNGFAPVLPLLMHRQEEYVSGRGAGALVPLLQSLPLSSEVEPLHTGAIAHGRSCMLVLVRVRHVAGWLPWRSLACWWR